MKSTKRCETTVTLQIRKITQKSKFLLSQAFKWKKLLFFVVPEMPSKTFDMVLKKLPDHFKTERKYRRMRRWLCSPERPLILVGPPSIDPPYGWASWFTQYICIYDILKIKHNWCLDGQEVPPYEEMALFYPNPQQRRPLILVGPPSIGRHELRQRLLDDTAKFAAPVPRKII